MSDGIKKRLLIIGAGGHGAISADCAHSMNKWSEICFLDSRWPDIKILNDFKVIGKDTELFHHMNEFDDTFVAIGNPNIRMKIIQQITSSNFNLARIIHSSAIISQFSSIHAGNLIAPGVVVNAGVKIKMGCIINTGATIDHDCLIEAGAHICPGVNLAGNVKVGAGSWVGIGASVINDVVIGDNTVIGAGAVVISNIPANVVAVGVPARLLVKES